MPGSVSGLVLVFVGLILAVVGLILVSPPPASIRPMGLVLVYRESDSGLPMTKIRPKA